MLGLNRQHLCLYLLAFLQNLRRMLYALGPAQVADVYETIDAVFDFDESPEVCEIANLAFDHAADRILLVQLLPRILLELFESERNAALSGIHVEHNGLNLVPWLHDLRGMLHPLRPGHFAYVNEPFNALLEFNESSVVGNAQNASFDMCADGIALGSIKPRVRCELLEP